MTYLYPIWLFFAAFFLYFAYVSWRQSTDEIRPFVIRKRGPEGQPASETDQGLSKANQDFVREFNEYLASVNKHNRARQRAAAVGYAVAGVVALISMGFFLFG